MRYNWFVVIFQNLLVLIHLFGFAGLFSGLVSQRNIQPKMINGWILGGALVQLITGLILTSLGEPDINHAKVGFKLGLLVVILYFAFKYRVSAIPLKTFNLLLLFTCLNTALAVLWP